MALADFVESATLVAVMVTDCAALTVEGAVYRPFDKVPTDGFMDQVTEVFPLPVTVAENCLVCDATSVALEGLTPTLMLDGPAGSEMVPEMPPAGIDSPKAVEATTPEI